MPQSTPKASSATDTRPACAGCRALTKYLRKKAEIKFKDGRCVIIPVGKLEDFEAHPVSVASMKSGLTFTE